MNKVFLALRSRTFWTVVAMLVFNFIPQLPIDQAVKDLINTILTALATYFHLNPSQNYTAPSLSSYTIDTLPPQQ